MRPVILLLAGLPALAACGEAPVLFSAPPAALSAPAQADPGARIGVPYRSIELREVSLPTYAEAETIFQEGPGGTLTPVAGAEWADLPERAITLDLVGVLAAVTDARVAAEPWPFDLLPEARVEVRATRLAAGADGFFRFGGQYYVADLRGELAAPRDRTGRFDLAAPYDVDGGAAAIADARSRVVRDLARLIAARGM